jgi:hypothetical protein
VAEIGVLGADLLVLLSAPPQLLVNVVGGYPGAVGEPHFFPVQWYCCGFPGLLGHNYLFSLFIVTLISNVEVFFTYDPELKILDS